MSSSFDARKLESITDKLPVLSRYVIITSAMGIDRKALGQYNISGSPVQMYLFCTARDCGAGDKTPM